MNKPLLLLLVVLSPAAFANQDRISREGINSQALQVCAAIKNDLNRLRCYDQTIAGKPLAKTTAKSSIHTNTATKRTANTTKHNIAPTPNNFGIEYQEAAKEKEKITEIKATVVAVNKAPRGELILTLNNQQQWRQKGSEGMLIKEKDTVIISRGLFNAFLLKKVGKNRTIRVKRIK